MTIKVKFFASLAVRVGTRESEVASEGVATVLDVWRSCTADVQVPDNALASVNREYADFRATVEDGDEVAFFPPVTGG